MDGIRKTIISYISINDLMNILRIKYFFRISFSRKIHRSFKPSLKSICTVITLNLLSHNRERKIKGNVSKERQTWWSGDFLKEKIKSTKRSRIKGPYLDDRVKSWDGRRDTFKKFELNWTHFSKSKNNQKRKTSKFLFNKNFFNW